ncbi:OmpP1/FadL family transporter [Pontibacter sp. SGAir0037]|uniref:OmpP1/FadL family transporter n=1 Tax=Pontibacter sp. SGAir0037 TaxID=2571030 RepID=UPI0010CD4D8F|nr:hypothetical protein [Pontibacter sp. SGAir0037]QCR24114.1 hypothetical protein C1N53_18290 [Pontibacter sp. SGAir0037]
MKVRHIVSASLALVLGWSGTAFAQTEMDALRYSRLGITGSARIQGIGGAQTALGADISTLSANPAGLGMFRRSEVSITPGFGSIGTTSIANRFTTSDEKNTVSIPHAGIVFSSRKGDNEEGDWRGASFGLSISRLNNYNNQINYRNTVRPPADPNANYHNTIVDYFAELANNRTLFGGETLDESLYENSNQSYEGLAYRTYLIDVFEDELGEYAAPLMISKDVDVKQREEIISRGSQSQFDIGVGTSYKDKLYLGASIGIVTVNFSQNRRFYETGYYVESYDENGQPLGQGNYSLTLNDEFTTQGTGINLKVGAIFRPVDAVRLGATIQTPTAYTFIDSYWSSLSATHYDGGVEEEATTPGEYNYALTTPFRATGGIAFFFNKVGFVTADIEYVNYANARFNSTSGESASVFAATNSNIQRNFKSGVNYKLGAEARYQVFRFRAGYNSSADPYTANTSNESRISTYTLGTGIRLQNFYIDAAYLNSSTTNFYSPYVFSDGTGPVVENQERMNNVVFTVGYNF